MAKSVLIYGCVICFTFLISTVHEASAEKKDPESIPERQPEPIPPSEHHQPINICPAPPEIKIKLPTGCNLKFEKSEEGCIAKVHIKCDENITLKIDCDSNEEFVECGICYEKRCGPEPLLPDAPMECSPCYPKCQCVQGYLRDGENKCVKQAQCPELEKNRCKMKPDTGFCRARFERYYYDYEKKRCEKFTWGGCGGNENKFWTLEECHEACSEGFKATENPNPVQCPARQSGGPKTCGNGCNSTSECTDGEICCENWCGKQCIKPGAT